MDSEDASKLPHKLLAFVKANMIVSSLFLFGMIFLGIGLMQFFSKPSSEIEFIPGEEVEGATTSEIHVDVSGEVQNPGVYKLNGKSRTQDALVAAGGFTAEADREYISKSMNLAAVLSDGMKLYIPKKGETILLGAGSASSSVGGIISINSASQSELESLPGIGPVTADKIIAGRPYGSLEDLVNKKAVGKATFEKIKDLIGL